MGIKKYFLDNATYGADDVNSVLSRLTTEGVALFNDTGSFIADLNTAISNAVSAGVDSYNINSLKVVKNGDVYSISSGVCFLPNGMQLVVDQSGYNIDVVSGQNNYVYVSYNVSTNDITIQVSNTAGDSDTVSLATINADGTITDTRQIAKAKIALATANFTATKQISVPCISEVETVTTVDIGSAGYNVACITESGKIYWLDVSDNQKHNVYWDSFTCKVDVQKSGDKLLIYSIRTREKSSTINADLSIKIY